MNDGKKRRSSAELPAHKRFEKSRSRWKGYPRKAVALWGEDER